MFSRIIPIFLLIIYTKFVKAEQVWYHTYECDPTFESACKTAKNLESYKIYQVIVKSGHFFKHFVWTFFDRPRITTLETVDKCLIDANFTKLLSGELKESISLAFSQRDCVKKSQGFDQLILESIHEFKDNDTLKSYLLKSPDSFRVDKTSGLLVSVDYYKSNITIEFSLNSSELMQQELPHYNLTPLKTLLKVKILNFTTKSCDSNMRLDFHLVSSKKTPLKTDIQRFTYDYYAFGVFKSFEVLHDPLENVTLSKMSFFWKDVSYSDPQHKRSSMLTADLDNFKDDKDVEPIFAAISSSTHNGSILFIAKNNENCFYRKKYLIWSATFGSEGEKPVKIHVVTVFFIVLLYLIPLCFLIAFAVLLGIRRFRTPNQYQPVAEDEIQTF